MTITVMLTAFFAKVSVHGKVCAADGDTLLILHNYKLLPGLSPSMDLALVGYEGDSGKI